MPLPQRSAVCRLLPANSSGKSTLSDSQATVTFQVTLLQNGQDASFTERSLFELKNGSWVYVSA